MSALEGANGNSPSTPPLRSRNGHDPPLPAIPSPAAAAGLLTAHPHQSPHFTNGFIQTRPEPPISASELDNASQKSMLLELEDGSIYKGFSFGAEKSISGEMVFQTGMVGYPESVTDPSYRGQILVITFPLIGNYGVPSRETRDDILHDLPAHFEAAEIHIAGLVVAAYSGEDFSHHLATSSLGTWLKEQGVPAMHGVDTRVLTKKIRDQGSMLGKLLVEKNHASLEQTNGHTEANGVSNLQSLHDIQSKYLYTDWVDSNTLNLVATGMKARLVGLS